MKYKLSQHGAHIAVGLLDANTAQEDINLSHNLLNTHAGDNYYNGVLNFTSQSKFYRFLINKYYLMYWAPNKTFSQLLKKATNKARSVINTEVEYENFMPQIYQHVAAPKQTYVWHHPKYNN
jgi:hypothetical protein